jgi:hypothetical protein
MLPLIGSGIGQTDPVRSPRSAASNSPSGSKPLRDKRGGSAVKKSRAKTDPKNAGLTEIGTATGNEVIVVRSNARSLGIQRDNPTQLNVLTVFYSLTLRGPGSANHTDPLPCLISCKPPDINSFHPRNLASQTLAPAASSRVGDEKKPPSRSTPTSVRRETCRVHERRNDSRHHRPVLEVANGPRRGTGICRNSAALVIQSFQYVVARTSFAPADSDPVRSRKRVGRLGTI